MFKFNFYSNVYLASDDSTEIKSLIGKHIAGHGNGRVWHKELGKDLINYVSRPDFLIEAIHYLRAGYGADILYSVTTEFLENITAAQIKSLLEAKSGVVFVSEVQGWLTVSSGPFVSRSADANKLRRLFTKIERVRIPIIANDKRPYIGDMVGVDEDMGIEPSFGSNAAPFYEYRFGSGHDGEHWLTKNVGAQVKATAEIKGTVLTRYYQFAEQGSAQLANVMILLDNTDIVMIIKDLVTIGPKITATRATTPDIKHTTEKDESKFTDKNGKPLSTIKLGAGDLIGTTTIWTKMIAAKYYPEYAGKFGTFHFSFIKYKFVQEYRTLKGEGTRNKTTADIANVPELTRRTVGKNAYIDIPKHWFIAPCSPESPVKCFK